MNIVLTQSCKIC